MHDLATKVAVVTGAGSGIGRAIALALSRAGMTVVAADIDTAGAAETCALAPTPAVALPVDVADRRAVEALAERVARDVGPVAVLCNNAGVAVGGALLDATPEDWRWLLEVNLMGVVHGCGAFVPRMIARGEPAHVVNTASIGGFLAGGDLGVYCTTKYAIVGYSEALRAELAPHRIGVSVLCPGAYRTRLASAARNRTAEPQVPTTDVAQLRFLTDADDPDTIAPHVLRGIRDDTPYIFTHTAFRSLLETRFATVLADVDRAAE
jgi:NAD(P)-dependent dehydrogenase (short-subunit alcohol dehydrogenase family)